MSLHENFTKERKKKYKSQTKGKMAHVKKENKLHETGNPVEACFHVPVIMSDTSES